MQNRVGSLHWANHSQTTFANTLTNMNLTTTVNFVCVQWVCMLDATTMVQLVAKKLAVLCV